MKDEVYCLNCTWFYSLHVAEGAKREVCEYPYGLPRLTIPELAGKQTYDDPHIKNVYHRCPDFTTRFSSQRDLISNLMEKLLRPPRRVILGLLLVLAALTLSSCTAMDVGNTVPFMARPTTTKEMAVADAPVAAYDRSIQTIMQMGGVITQLQPDTHRMSAVINGAVALNVMITPTGSGSLLSASQHVSTGYIALAPVRVCDEFFAAYRR